MSGARAMYACCSIATAGRGGAGFVFGVVLGCVRAAGAIGCGEVLQL